MPVLRRHLTTLTLSIYGVGVMVGAGIYVLIGKVAETSGNATWLAMTVAALVALPTGLSYAELSSRYPRSAGEAVFVDRAFATPWLSFVVGFVILASGITSVAAVSHGFAYYFAQAVPGSALSAASVILLFLGALTWINHRGIRESTWLNVLCTVVSVGALLVLVAAGASSWGTADLLDASILSIDRVDPTDRGWSTAVIAGAALSFYAYIGFEDICNVAEEVKAPHHAIPRAILLSLLVTAVLYASVGVTAVSVVGVEELARSDVPLALVAERLFPAHATGWLSWIALFAVTNTALFNLIMGSRILYGMGNANLIPRFFARIHPARQTPTWGIVTMSTLALVVALTGFLKVLAEATSSLILSAFFAVNLSLLVVHLRKIPPDDPDKTYFRAPVVIPILGMATTGYLVGQFSSGAYLRAATLAALGLALYLMARVHHPE